jgi:hypothetical protein
MAEQLHTIAAMMRVCAQQLAAKIDHEYYGLTPAQRLELRMLPCDMRNWADRIDPGRAPVPDNGSTGVADLAAARARRTTAAAVTAGYGVGVWTKDDIRCPMCGASPSEPCNRDTGRDCTWLFGRRSHNA